MPKKERTHFVLHYRDTRDDKIKTLKARSIKDSSLGLSFIQVSGFLFDEESLIIDPSEEDLKDRFAHTKSLHLSIYSVVAIEEVGSGHPGLKFKHDKSNILTLPKDRKSK